MVRIYGISDAELSFISLLNSNLKEIQINSFEEYQNYKDNYKEERRKIEKEYEDKIKEKFQIITKYYNEIKDEWITDNIINLPVKGGRDGGFRTYSRRSNIKEGKWRVNIKTENNKLIGRLRFEIVSSSTQPELTTEVK